MDDADAGDLHYKLFIEGELGILGSRAVRERAFGVG